MTEKRGTALHTRAVYFPAALACVVVMGRGQGRQRQLHLLVALLLCPALLLTDHGHFQYNCISLGLSVRGCTAQRPASWCCQCKGARI